MKALFFRSTIYATGLGLMIAVGQANAQTLPKKELPKSTPPPPAKHLAAAPTEPKTPTTAGARKPTAPSTPAAKQPTKPEAKKPLAAKAGQSNVGLLDQAYELLASADHDYNGHRANAMHFISAAAKALGGSVGGGGKGGEKQADSDAQVRNAKALLQQAVGSLTGAAHNDIASAISQLSTALSVK